MKGTVCNTVVLSRVRSNRTLPTKSFDYLSYVQSTFNMIPGSLFRIGLSESLSVLYMLLDPGIQCSWGRKDMMFLVQDGIKIIDVENESMLDIMTDSV